MPGALGYITFKKAFLDQNDLDTICNCMPPVHVYSSLNRTPTMLLESVRTYA